MPHRAPAPTYEPNPILAYLYRRFFEAIRVDETWIRTVREAASRGSVVYVLRNLSFLDFLALDYLTKRYELPRIRFANNLGLWVLEPLGKGWLRAVIPHGRPEPAAQLVKVIEQGGSAALFLKRPPNMKSVVGGKIGPRRSMTEGDDLVRALFALQRRRTEPILLVPQVFVWSKLPDNRLPGLVDSLLGTREWPGKIRTTLEFLRNYGHVALRAGEPIDLGEFLRTAGNEVIATDPGNEVTATDAGNEVTVPDGQTDDALIRRLTYAVLRKLERERRAIAGPAKKPWDRVRTEVVKSPKLQAIIRDLAGQGASERMVLTQRAYSILRELEAQPDPGVVRAVEPVFDYMINRIYDGIELDQEGLARVQAAARKGTVVLLPSHKSHLDYVILHYIFHKNDLQIPLVASGDNLAFFPVGLLFRRAGGFFIRRSFAGDRLYTSVVDAYIRRLIREGHSIEFYVEGGRSRSGKLLAPKLGLLNMVVEAALAVPNREVFFVPISIGYDLFVEGGSYVHEATGGEKQKETARGLLRTARLMRGRYGRIAVQFAEPISFDGLLRDAASRSKPPADAPDSVPPSSCAPAPSSSLSPEDARRITPAKRRALVTRLAHRVMTSINRVTAVTAGPVLATVLLNDPRRGLSYGQLLHSCTKLVQLLRELGATISPSLLYPDGSVREGAISEAARLFVDADVLVASVPGQTHSGSRRNRIYTGPDVVYRVPDDKRLTLDLSKNIIVHFLVPRALVATAMLVVAAESQPDANSPTVMRAPRAAFDDRARSLSRLFKYEFLFGAESAFDESLEHTLGEMIRSGDLSVNAVGDLELGPGGQGFTARQKILFYASILRTFLEGYRVAARSLNLIVKGPMAQKDLARRAISTGERMFLDREIERREAVTRVLFENAYAAFAEQGYVAIQQRKVSLAESFATAAAVGAIEARIAGYLVGRDAQEPME